MVNKKNLQEALEFANGIVSDDFQDVNSMNDICETALGLPSLERSIFINKLAEETRLSKKEVSSAIKNHKQNIGPKDEASEINKISECIPDFPLPNLKLPSGYTVKVDYTTGLPQVFRCDGKSEVLVAPVAVFPCQLFIPKDGARADYPELYQLVRYNPMSKSWEEALQLYKREILCTANKLNSVSNIGISVGTSNTVELAKFFQNFIDINSDSIKIIKTVTRFGWSVDKNTQKMSFVPFLGPYAMVPTSGDLAERDENEGQYGDVVRKSGTKEKAIEVIHVLKDNMAFVTMFAGMLASPVLFLLRNHLRECIGIDLSSKTSTGKTSLQRLCFNLIYGDCRPFVRSWQNATSNGVWGVVHMANHLPVIFDDTHLMGQHLADVPHALINGQDGDKQQYNQTTGAISNRKTRTLRSVIFFNGEVPISEKAVISNSSGLLGRVLMCKDTPFPPNFTADDVDSLVQLSFENCGHFRDEWLEHLSTLSEREIASGVTDISKLFRDVNLTGAYARLSFKAAVLVWSLQEATKVLGIPEINVHSFANYLKLHMKDTTEQVDIIKEIVREIANHVYQNKNFGEYFHPYTEPSRREGIYDEKNRDLVIKTEAIKRLVNNRREYKNFLRELLKEGYVTSTSPESINIYKADGTRTTASGIRFVVTKLEVVTGIDFNTKVDS